MININFDFIKLYESLEGALSEDMFLNEASNNERGKYKKAFLNLEQGIYFESADSKDIHGQVSNIVGTSYADKVKDIHDIYEIAKAYKIDTTAVDPENGAVRTLEPSELVTAINTKFKNSRKERNARIIQTRKTVDDKGVEKRSYTTFWMKSEVLHHIDGNHDNNAEVRPYTYKPTEDSKSKTTYLFTRGDQGLQNYLMIWAEDNKVAAKAHMLVHLLAIITAALGEKEDTKNLLGTIAAAFDTNQLSDKKVEFRFVNDVNKMTTSSVSSLAGYINSDVTYEYNVKLSKKYSSASNLTKDIDQDTVEEVSKDDIDTDITENSDSDN